MEALPTVILYKLNRIDLWVARPFIKAKFITLVNLLADEELMPEYLTEHDVSDELCRLGAATGLMTRWPGLERRRISPPCVIAWPARAPHNVPRAGSSGGCTRHAPGSSTTVPGIADPMTRRASTSQVVEQLDFSE